MVHFADMDLFKKCEERKNCDWPLRYGGTGYGKCIFDLEINDMISYHPVFGIRFLSEITMPSERIHKTSKRNPENRSDFLDLGSNAEHQLDKSEHPTPG